MMALGYRGAMSIVCGWRDEGMIKFQIRRFGAKGTAMPATSVLVVAVVVTLAGLAVLSAYQPEVSLLLGVGLPVGLGLIAWPEVTLGLYANAGLFKADPRLRALAGLADMTLMLGIILIAALVYRLVLRRERIGWTREMSLALIFAGVILLGILYTPASAYGMDKALRFVSLTMLAFFTPLVIMTSRRAVTRFFFGWLGIAMLLTADALSRLGSGQRLSGFNATSIAVSRTVGVAVLVLVFTVLMGRVARTWRILAVGGLVLMTLVLLGSGARGPFLSLGIVVALATGIASGRPGRRARSLLIIGILGLAILGVLWSGLVPTASIQRFNLLMSQADRDTSSQARLMVMRDAWQLFVSSPVIGRGIGSVSAFGAGREQVYPHNILLELAAETGVLGLGLYLVLVGLVLLRLLSKLSTASDHDALWLTLFATFLFTFLNAMVSGDLNDNRDLWLFAGVAIAATEIEGGSTRHGREGERR
ncbi:MAG: hypothetical protein D6791_07545 [Chloroflexi bacterium]|nr:MAG: hypothetical protein D6791_07545 [Chloroflexota bacterium]